MTKYTNKAKSDIAVNVNTEDGNVSRVTIAAGATSADINPIKTPVFKALLSNRDLVVAGSTEDKETKTNVEQSDAGTSPNPDDPKKPATGSGSGATTKS